MSQRRKFINNAEMLNDKLHYKCYLCPAYLPSDRMVSYPLDKNSFILICRNCRKNGNLGKAIEMNGC